MNRDGSLNMEGFTAACLEAGGNMNYHLSSNDLKEIFKLLATRGQFEYVRYFIEEDIDPDAKIKYF